MTERRKHRVSAERLRMEAQKARGSMVMFTESGGQIPADGYVLLSPDDAEKLADVLAAVHWVLTPNGSPRRDLDEAIVHLERAMRELMGASS